MGRYHEETDLRIDQLENTARALEMLAANVRSTIKLMAAHDLEYITATKVASCDVGLDKLQAVFEGLQSGVIEAARKPLKKILNTYREERDAKKAAKSGGSAEMQEIPESAEKKEDRSHKAKKRPPR